MQISVQNLSKRYSSEWIFRDLSFEFMTNHCYAISGANGTGKSTFLQILSGKLPATKGKIVFTSNRKTIKKEDIFRSLSMCAPYLELIEEFSLLEMLKFHFHLNKIVDGLNPEKIIQNLGFEKHKHKRLGEFSSGMKQKLKLALVLFTNKSCLLLDEPTSNLDENTKRWFKNVLINVRAEKLVIIASNEESDFMEGSIRLNIEDFR